MPKPKLEDVAKKAGVSPTTVSRVLNNRGAISRKTREKVHAAIEQLNYFPNEIARSLFVSKTNLIGLIFPTTANPFYGELIFHIESILSEKGYKVLICNTMNQAEKEKKYLRMLLANQVDGMIVGAHNTGIDIYHMANLPVVSIDRRVSETVPVIRSDNYQGGLMATTFLIQKNHRHIVHFNGMQDAESPSSLQRRKGYEDAMEKNHMEKRVFEIDFEKPLHEKREIIRNILNVHAEIDAIFIADDITAAITKNLAWKMGREIEIIGYDGTETIQECCGFLSTIVQPIREMAGKSVEILLKEIDGEFGDRGKEFVFPVTLKAGN